MWPFKRGEPAKAVSESMLSRAGEEFVTQSSPNFLSFFGIDNGILPAVTIEKALTVPSVWAAVAFLSRTLASLPLHAYRKGKDGASKVTGKLETVIHDSPNDEMDSFKFRQYFWQQVFTGGRGFAWVERTPQGIEAIWPMDPRQTVIQRVGLKTVYKFRNVEYPAADVIDVPFMLKEDGIAHFSPVVMGSKAIQLALAMGDYAGNFFAGGGVPPLALQGPMPTGSDGMVRAAAEIRRAIEAAKAGNSQMFPLPPGHTIEQVGYDPAKGQMTEARLFQLQEIARIYQLPRVFLQDLTGATNSNTEQQNLMLVQHLVGQWAQALEGEMNLKLFGRGNSSRYVEHNLDGILRGDFATRMAGLATSVQNAIRTPNEVRALENLPAMPNGNDLLIQGATVPLGSQLVAVAPKQPANDNGGKQKEPTKDEANAA